MALTSNWTSEIPARELPTGAVIPTVAALSGTVSTETITVTLTPASTYDNATVATAFAAIGAAVETACDTYLEDTIGVDLANTVTARYVLLHCRRGWPDFEQNDYPNQYLASVDEFVVTVRIEWKSEPAA